MSSDSGDDFSDDDIPNPNRTRYPSHSTLADQEWDKVGHRWGSIPNKGKYGDPANPELYDHWVVDHKATAPDNVEKMGRGTTKSSKPRVVGVQSTKVANTTQSAPPHGTSGVSKSKPIRQQSTAKHIARDSRAIARMPNSVLANYTAFEPSCGGRSLCCLLS